MSEIYKTFQSRQNRPTNLKPLYLIQAAKSILVIFRWKKKPTNTYGDKLYYLFWSASDKSLPVFIYQIY